jgi:uncharacterized delta-60 repeat protein
MLFSVLGWCGAGDLDVSLNGKGYVFTQMETKDLGVLDLTIDKKERIVTVGSAKDGPGNGQVALVRYESDGTLDTSFGHGGKVFTLLNHFGVGTAVKTLDDGKIVVAAYDMDGERDDVNFTLIRYKEDGTLDSDFGNNGIVEQKAGGLCDGAMNMAVTGDKYLLVGKSGKNGCDEGDFALLRFNNDGSIDDGFGENGAVVVEVNNTDEEAHGVLIQPDGKIVVSGYGFGGKFVVFRLNENGSADTSFNTTGFVTITFDENGSTSDSVKIALQKDGKIVVVGTVEYDETLNQPSHVAVARLDTNGSLDTTFGYNGKVLLRHSPTYDQAEDIVIQKDGKIVIAGQKGNKMAVIRLTKDGKPDDTFGQHGFMTLNADIDYQGIAHAVELQKDGKIVIGGYATYMEDHRRYDFFAVARILDKTFVLAPIYYLLR